MVKEYWMNKKKMKKEPKHILTQCSDFMQRKSQIVFRIQERITL